MGPHASECLEMCPRVRSDQLAARSHLSFLKGLFNTIALFIKAFVCMHLCAMPLTYNIWWSSVRCAWLLLMPYVCRPIPFLLRVCVGCSPI
jgi:hypothetical protein